MDDPILILFAIGAGGWLVFMLIAAFSGAGNKKKIDGLNEKLSIFREELKEVSIKQVIALNGMLENNTISQVGYYTELDTIYQRCIKYDIDITVLKEIKPGAIKCKDDLVNKYLNIASVLHESNKMTLEEFNENIDFALDQKNKSNS